ncbi:unnamed protein product, partial [Pleuronectes platessa]
FFLRSQTSHTRAKVPSFFLLAHPLRLPSLTSDRADMESTENRGGERRRRRKGREEKRVGMREED